MDTVLIPLVNSTAHAIVSSCDAERVLQRRWRLGDNGYPYSHIRLHQFIMGPRPDDVPSTWELDHKFPDPT